MQKTEKNLIVTFTIIGILLVGLIVSGFVFASKEKDDPKIEALARCLADKQVTMYGAKWCSHCQAQKKLFGKYFSLVPYMECPDNIAKCVALGVEGYPTWIFPSLDNTATSSETIKNPENKLSGEQSLEKLAEKSKCEYQ